MFAKTAEIPLHKGRNSVKHNKASACWLWIVLIKVSFFLSACMILVHVEVYIWLEVYICVQLMAQKLPVYITCILQPDMFNFCKTCWSDQWKPLVGWYPHGGIFPLEKILALVQTWQMWQDLLCWIFLQSRVCREDSAQQGSPYLTLQW